jgi:hypothetical protein
VVVAVFLAVRLALVVLVVAALVMLRPQAHRVRLILAVAVAVVDLIATVVPVVQA